MRLNRVYRTEKQLRMRARSFSRLKGEGGDRALRDNDGVVFVALIPMPTTERYSEDE